MTITAAELLVKVGADTSDAESGLKSFSSKMKNVGGQMAAVGGVLSATVAAPLIGIAVSAVKTAADFEKSMNVLGYASGATAKQMQALSDQALQLGADTVFSANEAAEGMVDLAKAGMKTEDIMGAIPGVMDLAAAGQIGVSEAANLTAAALNTFGLEATEAAHVADVLAAAANASTADVADLAFGMQNAGAVFASNSQSVETLATMMALLANNGINASDAATSLKTMTMRLTAPTKDAAKVMKNLGIQVFDASGNMRDYHDIVGDLSAATRGMSDAQKDAAFNTIFGADAIRAATILAREGTTGYEEMAAAVNTQGAAAAMAQAQNGGLAGTIEQITGSISSLMTKLALPFLPGISAMGDQITTFINQIGELPQPVINAGLAFAGFAAALALTVAAIGGAALLLAPLGGTVGLIALTILGLGLAVAALWAAWETNWGNIQGKTSEALGVIQPLIDALNVGLASATTMIGSGQQAIEDFAKAIGDTEWGTLAADVSILLALNPQFQSFVQLVKDAASALGALARKIGQGFGTLEMPDLSKLGSSATKTNIQMDLVATVQNLKLDWSQLKINTSDFVTRVGNQLSAIPWSTLSADFVGLMTRVGSLLTGAANTAFGEGNIVSKEIARIGATFTKVSDTMKGVDISQPMSVLNGAISAAIDLVGLVKGAQLDVVTGAVTTLETFVTSVLDVASQLTAGLDTTMLADAGSDLVKALSDAIVAATEPEKLGDLGTAAGKFTRTLVSKFGELLGAPGFGDDIGTAIGKATAAIATGAKTFAEKFAAQVALTDWGQFSGQIATFISGFIAALLTNAWKGTWMQPDLISEQEKEAMKQRQGIFPKSGGGFGEDFTPTPFEMPDFTAIFEGLTSVGTAATALGAILKSAADSISGLFTSLNADATSTSDILRDRALGSDVKNPLDALGSALATMTELVSGFTWPAVLTNFTWPAVIADFNWPAVIAGFKWPEAIANFEWPDLTLDWGRFISNITLPGAAGKTEAGNYGVAPGVQAKASGTSYFTGGTTWVGEHGPELVSLPQGSSIYSNQDSMAMAGGITINVNVASINNGMDIEQLAAQLARRFQQKLRL